ncbi:hypothetical protein VIGAN_09133500, partial [Vigna angularis var. angularis]
PFPSNIKVATQLVVLSPLQHPVRNQPELPPDPHRSCHQTLVGPVIRPLSELFPELSSYFCLSCCQSFHHCHCQNCNYRHCCNCQSFLFLYCCFN